FRRRASVSRSSSTGHHGLLLSAIEAPGQHGRRDHGGGNYHHHHSGEDAGAHHGRTRDGQGQSDIGKNQANFTAGNHADANGEAVELLADNAQAAKLLAGNGGKREGDSQYEGARLGKGSQVSADSHEHKKNGHEERGDRLDQFLQRVFATIDKIAVVQVLQDQSGCERAYDRFQSYSACQPRKQKAERQPSGEEYPGR